VTDDVATVVHPYDRGCVPLGTDGEEAVLLRSALFRIRNSISAIVIIALRITLRCIELGIR
jgi:hypothetical protein